MYGIKKNQAVLEPIQKDIESDETVVIP
jgi:hypothetical protein